MEKVADLKNHELFAAGILVAGIVFFGLFPSRLINLSSITVGQMTKTIQFQLTPLT